MVKARERVKGGFYKVKEDELKAAWPALNVNVCSRKDFYKLFLILPFLIVLENLYLEQKVGNLFSTL